MQLVITMVPGTWGRNSPWLMSDSRLSKVLRNQFGQELTIRNFDWTCWNSHTARKRASSDLRDQLRAQFKEFPSAKHFLI